MNQLGVQLQVLGAFVVRGLKGVEEVPKVDYLNGGKGRVVCRQGILLQETCSLLE